MRSRWRANSADSTGSARRVRNIDGTSEYSSLCLDGTSGFAGSAMATRLRPCIARVSGLHTVDPFLLLWTRVGTTSIRNRNGLTIVRLIREDSDGRLAVLPQHPHIKN